MSIKIGSTDIPDIKLGSTQISAVYQGSNLIWGGLTSFLMGSGAWTTPTQACADAEDTQMWHDGVGAYPVNGDIIYTNAGGLTTHPGNAIKYYQLGGGSQGNIGLGTGVVANKFACP